MQLQLHRQKTQSEGGGFTHGDLYIDNEWFCYTLEDELREHKVYAETAIPAGIYKIELINSPKFGPDSLWVRNVPKFEGILIHGGINEKHSAGCILVGNQRHEQTITGWQAVLEDLRAKIVRAIRIKGEVVTIEILNHADDHYVDTGNAAPIS